QRLTRQARVRVSRARRVERFLSQPFFVAEQFTGTPGAYVPIEETVRSFREIIEGKHDDIPERAFLLKGTIDDVVGSARGAEAEEEASAEGSDEEEGSSYLAAGSCRLGGNYPLPGTSSRSRCLPRRGRGSPMRWRCCPRARPRVRSVSSPTTLR